VWSAQVKKTTLVQTILKARDSTYLILPQGPSASVWFGTTDMPVDHLVANLLAAVPAAIEKIPNMWQNVQAIELKTESSTVLPIYNNLPFPEAVHLVSPSGFSLGVCDAAHPAGPAAPRRRRREQRAAKQKATTTIRLGRTEGGQSKRQHSNERQQAERAREAAEASDEAVAGREGG
jgi:hypothetical protein